MDSIDIDSLIDPEFCLSQLEHKQKKSDRAKLEELIQLAETTQVLGENPIKYWERNKILAHLDIKNPDYKISTAKIAYSNLDRDEFDKQIEELLKLRVIRNSYSPHRSSAFFVRNHAQIKRGKARMVINYKRLNDNTNVDSYDIPSKE